MLFAIEDFVEKIAFYTSKKKANLLAEQIYDLMGRNQIKLRNIDILVNDLIKEKIPDQKISRIINLFDMGKKAPLISELYTILGEIKGEKFYRLIKDEMEQKKSDPHPGSLKKNT